MRRNLSFASTLIVFLFSLSCFQTKKKSFTLIDNLTINSFPSASAVEFHNEKFYVFGDDAPYLLILDTSFSVLDKIYFEDSTAFRLPPAVKPDIESTTILKEGNRNYLYAFGSHSSTRRKKILKFPLDSLRQFAPVNHIISDNSFIKVINIEGAAFVNKKLLLANRANNSFRKNYIFFEEFENNSPHSSMPQIMQVEFPEAKNVTGLSGLYYNEEKDILFFTASQEETNNPLVNGAIGKSFLGWIYDFSKSTKNVLKPDKLIDLSDADSKFRGSKIESLTVQSYDGNNINIILVADNDDGKSSFYKAVIDISR